MVAAKFESEACSRFRARRIPEREFLKSRDCINAARAPWPIVGRYGWKRSTNVARHDLCSGATLFGVHPPKIFERSAAPAHFGGIATRHAPSNRDPIIRHNSDWPPHRSPAWRDGVCRPLGRAPRRAANRWPRTAASDLGENPTGRRRPFSCARRGRASPSGLHRYGSRWARGVFEALRRDGE